MIKKLLNMSKALNQFRHVETLYITKKIQYLLKKFCHLFFKHLKTIFLGDIFCQLHGILKALNVAPVSVAKKQRYEKRHEE